ncbi:hypothetical protein EDB83DRAFT_1550047 [Lactarius deliciosus]|nr:hypothetical protein EDB83DRAFT_1550047 [Lactarius deliciosus]
MHPHIKLADLFSGGPIVTPATAELRDQILRIRSCLIVRSLNDNTLQQRHSLRLQVDNTLLDLASITTSRTCCRSPPCLASRSGRRRGRPENSACLEHLVDTFSRSGQPDTAYNYKPAYNPSLELASQATQSVALDAIATALSDPATCDFDPLLQLDADLADASVLALCALPDTSKWRDRRPPYQAPPTRTPPGIRYMSTLSHQPLAFLPHPYQTPFFIPY